MLTNEAISKQEDIGSNPSPPQSSPKKGANKGSPKASEKKRKSWEVSMSNSLADIEAEMELLIKEIESSRMENEEASKKIKDQLLLLKETEIRNVRAKLIDTHPIHTYQFHVLLTQP